MEFEFKSRCDLRLAHTKGSSKATHVETNFNLEVSDNLDKSQYLTKENLPTKAGSQAVTQCFVQGLVANIHFAHQEGHRDSAEHLRYIISELERGFSNVAEAYKSNFNS